MSLGVLNNLSAIYAENNLNNTNNSLNTVLQQLSSGSKINSGADDAAGLSLVDGLQANSMALAQSQTNASEGVGLLTVADGALSQVTNLLNRAVTLATEASNGTLNSSQDTAANQEYQSILSEINNIGTTTTYNNQTVFGAASPVNIYTGDSSTAGSSIDSLNIQSLSSSNVGDTGGVMAYSNGASNVFLNLSSSTANAAVTDTLNSTAGKTSLAVNYLVKGANGASTTASDTITVGSGTNYSNTAGGLISAINNAGLGLNATFTTQAGAGVQGGGTQTGIEISGGLVSAGLNPNASSTSGALDLTGLAAGATLALGATVTVNQGSQSQLFTIGSSNNTLATLAGVISGAGIGVNANVVTNGDGTQSLSLADSSTTGAGGALSVSTTAGTVQTPTFSAGSTGSLQNVQTQGAQVNGVTLTPAAVSTIVVGTGGTDSATEQLTAGTSITITNSIPSDMQTQTFVIGNGNDVGGATGTHYTQNAGMGAGGNTLATLADTINAQSSTLGVYATVGASGLTITTGTYTSGTAEANNIVATNTTLGGETVAVTQNNLTAANTGVGGTKLALYTPTIGGTTAGGSPTITVLDTSGHAAAIGDVLSGSFTLDDAQSGTAQTFTMNGTSDTWTTLMQDINGSNLGVSASFITNADGTAGHGGLQLTDVTNGVNTITVGGAGITDGANAVGKDATGTGHQAGVAGNSFGTASTAILQLTTGNLTDTGGSASVLGGAVNIGYGGVNQVFIMGSDPGAASSLHVGSGAIYTGGTSVTSLINAINASAIGGVTNALYAQGVTALDNAGMGGTGGIYLQGAIGTATPFALTTVSPAGGTETPLAVTTAITVNGDGSTLTHAGSAAATGVAAVKAADSITANGTALATSDTMAGSITIANGGVTDTFNVGTGADAYSGSTGTYYTNNTNTATGTGLPGAVENYGNTLAGLAQLIGAQSATLGLTAVASTNGLTVTQSTAATGSIATSSNSLTDVNLGTYSNATTSAVNEIANESDTLSGALVFKVGTQGATQTVTMANVTAGGVYASTVQGLIGYINANQSTLGVNAQWNPAGGGSTFGNIQLNSGTQGPSTTLAQVDVNSTLTSLVDTTGGAALTYTTNSAYNTGISSGSNTVYDSTAKQTASVGQAATFASDSKASSGVATISYTDGAGQSLSATNLSNQTNAEASLTALNAAITDVAAQDGYVGAQINTLNAVSSVLSTQQENVTSAQNAVQATDYASATSNMSKYEILSQTGISALAQANSMQQEVTKLLQ